MLRMAVIFPVLLLLCSAMATGEIHSPNQVEAGALSEDASAEGRACGSCGGTVTKPDKVKPDLGHLLGGDIAALIISGLGSLSVLIFNILGIVLLALLLKNLLSDSTGATGYAPTGYAASPSSYADPLSYHKRSASGGPSSSWSLQDIQESPAFTFLTQVVMDAIEKK